MLDWTHKVTLKAVEEGDPDDSPALRTLVASGLVEQQPDDRYALTAAGRVALDDDKPERWERILWSVVGALGVIAVIFTVIGLVT